MLATDLYKLAADMRLHLEHGVSFQNADPIAFHFKARLTQLKKKSQTNREVWDCPKKTEFALENVSKRQ